MPLIGGLRIWLPAYAGAKLFSYAAGTTTKINTFTSSALSTPNSNPLVADANGLFTNIFADPSLAYKFVAAPSTDTDPPTNPLWTVDNATIPAEDILTILAKSANYTVTVADGNALVLLVDASLGAVTITPYTSVGNAGRSLRVIKVDGSLNAVTIDPVGSQTWGGDAVRVLRAPQESTTAVADGNAWSEMARVQGDLIMGIGGETLAAGTVVYRSEGHGGLTAGRWYKTDADLRWASDDASEIGVVVSSDLTAGVLGAIRLKGRARGFGSLSAGSLYYASATAGAVTTTPTPRSRLVGLALSDTEIALHTARAPRARAGLCEGRLTLTSSVPVTTADVTAAGTLYFTPYLGNEVSLYDGTRWLPYTFAQISLALVVTSAAVYDVFLYDNAGTLTLELEPWASTTTRSVGITRTDGWWTRDGATTRRLVGTILASGSNTCEDSHAKRLLQNASPQCRVPRPMRVLENTASWSYGTPTMRQANASTANQFEIVNGLIGDAIAVDVFAHFDNNTVAEEGVTAIGEDSTTVAATGSVIGNAGNGAAAVIGTIVGHASLRTCPALGRHLYQWLEYASAGTNTWRGDGTSIMRSGMEGMWRA